MSTEHSPKKQKHSEMISKLMLMQMPAPINPSHPLKHYHQETVSVYEFLGDIEEVLLDSVSQHHGALKAAIQVRALREVGLKFVECARTKESPQTAIVSEPTHVDFMTNMFATVFRETYTQATDVLKEINYENQQAYYPTDPTKAEKSADFEVLKQQLIQGLETIDNKRMELLKEYYTTSLHL